MRARRLFPFPVLVLLFALGVPAPAAAERGVHVDPDSPAGKEYAIPLEQARSDAGGSKHSRSPQSSRFGAGIEPSPPAAAPPARPARRHHKAATRHSSDASDRSDAADGKKKQQNASAGISNTVASAAGDSGSPALRIGRIALAVLVVGGLLGLALRRSLRGGV